MPPAVARAALLPAAGAEYVLLILTHGAGMSTRCSDASCFAPIRNTGSACSKITCRRVLPVLCPEWQVGGSPCPPAQPPFGWVETRSFCHSLVSPQSSGAGLGFRLAPKYVGTMQVIHLAMKLICMVKDNFKGVS